jgi:hypothetical protein
VLHGPGNCQHLFFPYHSHQTAFLRGYASFTKTAMDRQAIECLHGINPIQEEIRHRPAGAQGGYSIYKVSKKRSNIAALNRDEPLATLSVYRALHVGQVPHFFDESL